MNKRYVILYSMFLIVTTFFALYPDIALAAEATDQTTVAQIKNSFSTAMGSKFTDNLSALFLSFQHIARIIVVIMTALAGIMIAFGLGGANQMFFKWIFGVGVVANIADFGWDLFGDYWVENGTVTADDASGEMEKITKLHGAKENDAAWYDVFSNFMNYYTTAFINPAYARLMPIAVKMTMVLWFIDTSMKVALGLTQQDLINFFTKQILKLGIYIFLITNWWNPVGGSTAQNLSNSAGGGIQIMAVLGDGFENLGYYAAGGENLKDSDNNKVVLQSNSIFKNTMALWSTLWGSLTKSEDKGTLTNLWNGFKATLQMVSSPIIMFVDIILLFVVIAMLILMALEMFMVRVEFYTMAVLSIMLLPFAMIDQLKFLSDKAISLMFNLALKCFVMAFMSVGVVRILTHFIDKLKAEGENNIWTEWYLDWTLIIQLVLLVSFLYLLVKKVPQLCNGLLSGNPSLSGGDLSGQIGSTLKVAGMVGAAVATGGAGAAAGAAGATGGVMAKTLGAMKGGMGAMGRGAMNYGLTQNPLAQGFSQGMNLFSGNAQGGKGLAQKGGLSQALGLSHPGEGGGLVDRMKSDSGDKSKYGDKPKGNSTSNNNNQNQNQNTPAATGKDGGKETIEKQIGEVNKQLDRIEKILNGGGGNGGTNPSGNSGNVNLPGLAGLVNRFTSGSSGRSYQKDDNASSQGGFTLAKATNGKGQTIPIYVPNSAPDNGSIPQHTNLTHNAPTGKHWSGKSKK